MLSYQTPAKLQAANAEANAILKRNLAQRGTGSDTHLSPQQSKDFAAALASRKKG